MSSPDLHTPHRKDGNDEGGAPGGWGAGTSKDNGYQGPGGAGGGHNGGDETEERNNSEPAPDCTPALTAPGPHYDDYDGPIDCEACDPDAPDLEDMVEVLETIGMELILVSPAFMDELLVEMATATAYFAAETKAEVTVGPNRKSMVIATDRADKIPRRKGRGSDESAASHQSTTSEPQPPSAGSSGTTASSASLQTPEKGDVRTNMDGAGSSPTRQSGNSKVADADTLAGHDGARMLDM